MKSLIALSLALLLLTSFKLDELVMRVGGTFTIASRHRGLIQCEEQRGATANHFH